MAPLPAALQAADPASRSGTALIADRLIEVACLGLLVVCPLLMNVAGVRTFEAMKLAGIAPMASLIVLGLVIKTWLSHTAWPLQLVRDNVFKSFVAWLACVAAATLLSESPWIAFYGEYFRREGFVVWLICGVMFLGILASVTRHTELERVFDAVLVSSVVPCTYAIMQRFGLDFFDTAGLGGGTSAARPGANLGNPTFLSAYLLLVIPLTICRITQTDHSKSVRAFYAALTLLQIYSAVLTQSRGPLLALAVVMLLVAMGTAARLRIRWVLWGSIALFFLALAALATVNFSTSVQAHLQGTPLQRFVIAGAQDLTSTSRVAIWQAGVDAFLQAPAWRQLIGYGPDTAYVHYFPHLSPQVLRIEGYAETIDRLHSETLESAMTSGVLGWLFQVLFFSALTWTTASRLAQWSSRRAFLTYYSLCAITSLLIGYAFALVGKSPALFPLGLGLGIGAAWAITILLAIRRMYIQGNDALDVGDDILMIALTSGLIGSWIESQVGVPTVTTRLMTATYGAAILLIALGGLTKTSPLPISKPDVVNKPATRKSRRPHSNPVGQRLAPPPIETMHAGWLTSLALIVVTVAYFPPLTGRAIHPPSIQKLHLIVIPLVALMLSGAFTAWHEMKRNYAQNIEALSKFLMWTTVPWFLFLLMYVDLGRAISGAGEIQVGERINNLLLAAFGSWIVMVLVRILTSTRISGGNLLGSSALLALIAVTVGGAFWAAMLDVRADTYLKLSGWAQQNGKSPTQNALLQQAVSIAPFERRYASAYASNLVEQSAQRLSKSSESAAILPEVLNQLLAAEHYTRQSVLRAPRDPWMNYAHANVHQFIALEPFATHLPKGERDKHIAVAQEYFSRAHQQFPAHPWILRNWAQLEYELGNKQAAYAKFDQMERLDPLNISAYTDRVRVATAAGDHQVALATLDRGISSQPPGSSARNQLKVELASYHRKLGNLPQALVLWIEVFQANPDNVDVAGSLIDAYMQLGQSENALSIARRTLTQLQTEPQTRQKRALRAKIEAFIASIPATSGNR